MTGKKFYIVPNRRTVTSGMKESGSYFLCPTNAVMTGRYHSGDENGQTQYEYATLKAVDENGNAVAGIITVEDVRWDSSLKESSGSGYDALSGRVIVGRQHQGDENGQTQYATAIVKIDGKATTLAEGVTSASIKESSGTWFKTDANRVITGRHHSGDENGQTYYTSAKIVIANSSTDPAPEGTIIVPDQRSVSATMKESSSSFMCPSGTVMTGRMHTGDENGNTQYEYATLKAINPKGEIVAGNITIEDIRWHSAIGESFGGGFDAPQNRVIIGRKHQGDENAETTYATGIVKFNGHLTEIKGYTVSETRKESGGWNWFRTANNQVMTGRHHYGDENGNTYYCMGTISCDKTEKAEDKFKIIVSLHPGEGYYPMNPSDFIVLSRFRKHNEGGSDDGYNKSTNRFENNNDHSAQYYNIPVNIINSYYVKNDPVHALYNLRPRDKASIGNDEVFLEPDDNLRGDWDPNGRVPVFTYSSYYETTSGIKGEKREFWLFYGYDEVDQSVVQPSHQGDWERIILDIVNDKIQGAWLDQHGDSKYYSANELEISNSNGIQILRVYSAQYTHATYEKVGEFSRKAGFAKDVTSIGYQWEITQKVENLSEQPWYLYAGAWGEVGQMSESTGPLGPWYKRWDYGKQNDSHIPMSSFINSNQLLIVPNIRYESEDQLESDGVTFETPSNMLITGRKHSGDENGKTRYQYATLKAINNQGKIVEGTITITERQWSEWHKESDSSNFFQAPTGRIITGRQHSGDENGNTRYQTAKVLFNGNPVIVTSKNTILPNVSLIESIGCFIISSSRTFLIGRTHTGDENGETVYYIGYMYINK